MISRIDLSSDISSNDHARVAWGILGRGVFWVSGLPTFLKPFFNDVLKVLETSHGKQMCSLLPKVSFVTSALFLTDASFYDFFGLKVKASKKKKKKKKKFILNLNL